MTKIVEGKLSASGKKYAIVVSRFNDFITSKLLDGSLSCLRKHDANDSDIEVYWVPGAFEIPLMAKKLAKLSRFDAIVCLGAVIKGATDHYEYVCSQVASGVAKVALDHEVPTIFGVLTTDTIEQAIERAGTKSGNKGYECAVAAIEMSNLVRILE